MKFKEKMHDFIVKQIRKTKLYQDLRDEMVKKGSKTWELYEAKAKQYFDFVAVVSERNAEVIRLLQDQICIASDVHFKSNSVIIVLSRLGNGQVRFIDAEFKDLRQLMEEMNRLKEIYQVPEERMFIDFPGGWRKRF